MREWPEGVFESWNGCVIFFSALDVLGDVSNSKRVPNWRMHLHIIELKVFAGVG
jgi:hypothetical protein